ncbi:lysostaphin resistance A-like protein [Segatella copri]|uniref:CPBP family intramembrane glutamic endopeptidase n=1 Tax=Segatella copri TaxID=165179 RepID=UPI003F70241E
MAKINLKRGLTDVVLYLIIFIVVQIIMMYAGAGIWAGIKGEGYQATLQAANTGGNAILTALISVFSSVITLIIFLKAKWTPLTRGYLLSKPWGTLLWVALFTLGTIIPLSFLYEQLGIEMDENTQQIFTSLMKEPWGYVAVGILAPLAEEVVFRGAILRTLLGIMSKKNHWVAIIISAALFGLAHFNAAQFINALLMGLLLGWMYYRTGSLVPGILLHWINNTMAYVLTNIMPQSDGKLIDLFHGDEKTVYYAVGFSLCIMIPSFIQMIIRLKKAKA